VHLEISLVNYAPKICFSALGVARAPLGYADAVILVFFWTKVWLTWEWGLLYSFITELQRYQAIHKCLASRYSVILT